MVLWWPAVNSAVKMTDAVRPACRQRCQRHENRENPVRGTHKGHHCQEGVRIWPGAYVLPSGLG